LFNDLNQMQKLALECTEGPILIVAGAGSGKTRVVTYKIAKLLIEKRANSYEVTAVTFTNKAANEMKERVKHLLYKHGLNVDNIFINTFHSYCASVLRANIDKIGFSKNFVIYDADDQKQVISNILKEKNIDKDSINPRDLISLFSNIKNLTYSLRPNSLSEELFIAYEKNLKLANALDFSDLLKYTVLLFKQEASILNYYQDRARYFFVDEYQDTNKIQYELIKLLAFKHKNICVVGDEDQSIYKWRGADIRNILDFEKDFNEAKIIKLEENYRSTKNIINASSSLINNNLSRKEKVLFTNNCDGEKINIVELDNDINEAKYICEQIIKLTRQNFKYNDIAVFYRINAQSRIIEDELILNKIPYKIIGGIKFYSRKEIKDLTSYLRLIINYKDNASFLRIINTPARGIGKKTIEKLTEHSIDKSLSIFEAIDSADITSLSKIKLKNFKDLINEANNLYLNNEKPSFILKFIIDKTNYLENLKDKLGSSSDEKIENISALLSAVYDFEEKEKSLDMFLENISLSADNESELEEKQGVSLMTLHSAKGLEFDLVFIQGLEEGLIPYSRFEGKDNDIEEERRLLYVGMTRAKKKLYMSYASSRRVFGGFKARSVSSFINEIDKKYLNLNLINNNSFNNKNYVFKDTKYINDFESYYLNKKVKHAVHGIGIIRKVQGEGEKAKVTVDFKNSGIKKLLWGYANLIEI